MEETLSYIKKYFPNAEIISDSKSIDSISNKIPDAWKRLFDIKDLAARKTYLLNTIWRSIVSNEMRNTINYLNQHITVIELLEIDGAFSILYGLSNEKGKTVYYKGDSPVSNNIPKPLKEDFTNLPEVVKAFYTRLHNGFYYLASESMGLVPLSSVTRLADEEWGILDELTEPLPVDMEHTYGFFTNGMGGYVVIDTANDNKATLWWTRKKPKPDINFWDVVDEWVVLGMQS